MKKIFFVIVICLSNVCIAQQKDTVWVKEQKGFLFLSEHNFQYDYHGEESRPLGFHDFFFPGECLDSLYMVDSNKAITFRNGLRIDYIHNRLPLKEQATMFRGKDTSICYVYDRFYIMPVIISYKQAEDYWPFECRRNYFDIQVEQGAALHFEYRHQMIKPATIVPIKKNSQIKKTKRIKR